MSTTPPPARNGKISKKKKNQRKKGKAGPSAASASLPAEVAKDAAEEWAGCWQAWSLQLSKRKSPPTLAELLEADKHSPLGWCLDERQLPTETRQLLQLVERSERGKRKAVEQLVELVESWPDDAAPQPATIPLAVEALAWTHALPALASHLDATPARELLRMLIDLARQAENAPGAMDPLAHQLLGGELPLTLAYLLGDLDECRGLAETGRRTLSAGIVQLLDGEGLPHSRQLALLRPLLACWTRCAAIGRELGVPTFDKDGRLQYEWLVRQALRLTRHDGRQMLAGGGNGDWVKPLLQAALRESKDREDVAIAGYALPRWKVKRKRRLDQLDLPEPASHSEWSEMAVMRASWSRTAPLLAVTYSDRRMRIELNCRGETLLAGSWDAEIRVGDAAVASTSDWTEVCWFTDDDVDYLELEMELEGGRRLQRQITLAREDLFLLVCDAVLAGHKINNTPGAAALSYRCRLPLSETVQVTAADETRELFLKGDRPLAAVLPLALSEWRAQKCDGALEITSGGLELSQSTSAAQLYAPLFLDLHPRRFQRELTWRQLTVAERLEIQPPDVAAGYRVQVGRQQWLVYRSLAPPANRTLLGQNLSNEFLVARFDRAGELEEMLEVEGTE